MLTIDQLAAYLPPGLMQKNPQSAVVEYLQHEILDSIFKQKSSLHLSFIGGTAIRVIYQSPRFSEDLDFDNFGMSFAQFEALLTAACKDMSYKGFEIEYRFVEKGAFHCYIKFPDILHKAGISPLISRKILIRIDTEEKEKNYEPREFVISRFALYRRILAAPPEVLLAQKMLTVLGRKREKGRDLFDVSYLIGIANPDFQYLAECANTRQQEFLRRFDKRLEELDLNFLAKDVEPFLFNAEQRERILAFKDYWAGQSARWRES